MKRWIIAASALVFSFATAGVASAECKGNCHNFVTAALSGSWVRTASGGYVHDKSAVCDIMVHFEIACADLTEEGEQVLLYNLDIIMHSGAVGFANTGFASVDGPEDYNQTLSEERAATVYEFLVANGVDMDMVAPVSGGGETEAWSDTLEGNRVVVLSFNG